jgi:hypothetical protein
MQPQMQQMPPQMQRQPMPQIPLTQQQVQQLKVSIPANQTKFKNEFKEIVGSLPKL